VTGSFVSKSRLGSLLITNPRVSNVSCGAKKALNDRLIADKVRELLRDISVGGPFANDGKIKPKDSPHADGKKRVKKTHYSRARGRRSQ